MAGLSRLIVAAGLAVALPSVASADLPAAPGEQADGQRAELRQAILKVRAIVSQVKSPRFCGPAEEVRAAERTLEQMERAYRHHLPYPVQPPKPAHLRPPFTSSASPPRSAR